MGKAAALGMLLVALLAGQGQAQSLKFHDAMPPVSIGMFIVVEGQVEWQTSGPPASNETFAKAFWGQRRMTGAPQQRRIEWRFSESERLDFDDIDDTMQQMRCTSNVRLAVSAQAMLDTLGCVWDSS